MPRTAALGHGRPEPTASIAGSQPVSPSRPTRTARPSRVSHRRRQDAPGQGSSAPASPACGRSAPSMGAKPPTSAPRRSSRSSRWAAPSSHVRPAAGDQVSSDGYAETPEDYATSAPRALTRRCAGSCRYCHPHGPSPAPSPKLITPRDGGPMKHGRSSSTWRPWAAATACSLHLGEEVTDNAHSHSPATPTWASRPPGLNLFQMYATNMVNLAKLATPAIKTRLKSPQHRLSDERSGATDRDPRRRGHPTAADPGSAAPKTPLLGGGRRFEPAERELEKPKKERPWWFLPWWYWVSSCFRRLIVLLTKARKFREPQPGTFALACVVGYYVVWNVHARTRRLQRGCHQRDQRHHRRRALQLPKDNMVITVIAARRAHRVDQHLRRLRSRAACQHVQEGDFSMTLLEASVANFTQTNHTPSPPALHPRPRGAEARDGQAGQRLRHPGMARAHRLDRLAGGRRHGPSPGPS